ncbi:MAG TPA: hypothetical protein GYA10_01460, partial [Alphaproteobacteria bacterium]|nr:hypothetical protein [Alphaproteobacteria bacterium]
MTARRRPWGAAAAASAPVALVLTLALPAGAIAAPAAPDIVSAPTAPAPDYPSWDDVRKAKRHEAAAQAEIDRIEGILVALENRANELGKEAQLRAEEYAIAREQLDEAARRVARIELRRQE